MNSPRTAPHTKPKGIPPPMRFATVTTPFKGRFSQWKFGTRVRVLSTDGDMVVIERVQWVRANGKRIGHDESLTGLHLVNQCADVKRENLDFE